MHGEAETEQYFLLPSAHRQTAQGENSSDGRSVNRNSNDAVGHGRKEIGSQAIVDLRTFVADVDPIRSCRRRRRCTARCGPGLATTMVPKSSERRD